MPIDQSGEMPYLPDVLGNIVSETVVATKRMLKERWSLEEKELSCKYGRVCGDYVGPGKYVPIMLFCEECGANLMREECDKRVCDRTASVRLKVGCRISPTKAIKLAIEAIDKGLILEDGVAQYVSEKLKESLNFGKDNRCQAIE